MRLGDGLNRSDTLGRKRVRQEASLSSVFSTRPGIEQVSNGEVGEGVVELRLQETCRMPIDRLNGPRVGDRDVVRSNANKGTYGVNVRC